MLDEVYSKGNLSVADEIVAPPILRGSVKNAISTARSMLSNLQVKIEDMIAEDDKVVARCLINGNFARKLFGITLSNRSIETTFIAICRVDNDQIKGFWFLGEPLLFLRQLGLWAILLFFIESIGKYLLRRHNNNK